MNRKLVSTLTILCALVSVNARQKEACSHRASESHALKAYLLTDKQEESFDPVRKAVSSFWSAWDNDAALATVSIDGSKEHLGGGLGPENADDCRVEVMAAYGDKGVYLLFEVTDDSWIGALDPTDYVHDALDVFMEKHSSKELYESTSLFKDIDVSQLTETYCQIQVRFAVSRPEDQLSYNNYHPDLRGQNLTLPQEFVEYNRSLALFEMEATYGMVIKVLPASEERRNVRHQEWLIPWVAWGGPNGSKLSKPQPGTLRLAFAFGYNDKDSKDDPSASYFRWRNASDPYTVDEAGCRRKTTVDCWGDIAFVGKLDGE